MQKDFSKLNYYEMLDISPDAAFFEIRHAYNAALQIYGADSMVSYSLFSREERKKYDSELTQSGLLPQKEGKTPLKRPACIYDVKRKTGVEIMPKKTTKSILRENVEGNKLISEIISRPEISGADLKNIRNELGVPLEEIAQETRVRLDYLTCIEEDKIDRLPAMAFLKGFIKAYLKILCLEPVDDICAHYIKWLESAGKKS